MEEISFDDLKVGTKYRINWAGNSYDKKIVTLESKNRRTRQLVIKPDNEYAFMDSFDNLKLTLAEPTGIVTPPRRKKPAEYNSEAEGGRRRKTRKSKKRSRKTLKRK
jgi:hypothetical protein